MIGSAKTGVLEREIVQEGCVAVKTVISGHERIFLVNHAKIGEDYDGEMVINSEGAYLYLCGCGVTSIGNLNDISLQQGQIDCLGCEIGIGAGNFMGRGPRIYKIYGPGREIPK